MKKNTSKKSTNSNKKGNTKMEIKFDHITSEEFANIMKSFENDLEKYYEHIDSELRKYNYEYLNRKRILTTYYLCKYVCETVDTLIDEITEAFQLLDKAIRTLNAAGDVLSAYNYHIAYYYMYLDGMEHRFRALESILKTHSKYKIEFEKHMMCNRKNSNN